MSLVQVDGEAFGLLVRVVLPPPKLLTDRAVEEKVSRIWIVLSPLELLAVMENYMMSWLNVITTERVS